jgi:phage-related protein
MKIIHFKQPSGREPVRDYILSLPKNQAAEILAALEDIEENGIDETLVVLKPIEGKLWEIKLPIHRIFYVLISGPMMVLLHAIKKEGQKTPIKDRELAKKRMKLVLGGQNG